MAEHSGSQSSEKARHAATLGELRTAAWDALRAFNRDPSRDRAEAIETASDSLDEAVEAYRRAYHPRAHRLAVTCDHTIGQPLQMFTVSRTGRSIVDVTPSLPSEPTGDDR